MAPIVPRLAAAAAAFLLCAAPLTGETQAMGRVYRLGVLGPGSAAAPPPVVQALRQELHELGWVEGRNIVIEYRYAEYRYDRLPELAAELVRREVDVIVAPATPAAVAAKGATGTIPIVMVGVGDPVGSGLVASLARPGGNVTGTTYTGAGYGIYAKQLSLLVEAVPKVRRVAILSNPTNLANPLWIQEIKGAGTSLGVQIQFLEAQSPADLDAAFTAMAKERAGALLVVADSMFMLHRARLVELATKGRLPLLGYSELVDAGGLMSYGPSLPDLGRRAAAYVNKILRGAKPADLPIEQPDLELVINLKTARALGLAIPPSLLVRANRVIE